MRISAALLLLVAWPVAAQSVHKCADGRGGHSYQSQPCVDGESLRTWTAEVQDPPATTAMQRPTKPPTQRRAAASTRDRPTRATPPRRDWHARCLAARASRENALRKLGTQRRYDDLRRLNERVSAVCNHRGRG